jgi:Ala-tRNA(Pro) deacylase
MLAAYSLLLLADAEALGTEQVIGRLHTAMRIAYNLVSETLSCQEVAPMLSRILKYLDQNGVGYSHHAHPYACTAREVASAEHVPTHEVAKTVVFVEDDGYGMAVLGADCAVDMYELRMLLGQPRLRLVTERELAKLFPECELGAIPPFGSLFHMPVYMDSRLAGEGIIEFNAGTHRDVVRLRFRDYESLEKPIVVNFARVVAA